MMLLMLLFSSSGLLALASARAGRSSCPPPLYFPRCPALPERTVMMLTKCVEHYISKRHTEDAEWCCMQPPDEPAQCVHNIGATVRRPPYMTEMSYYTYTHSLNDRVYKGTFWTSISCVHAARQTLFTFPDIQRETACFLSWTPGVDVPEKNQAVIAIRSSECISK